MDIREALSSIVNELLSKKDNKLVITNDDFRLYYVKCLIAQNEILNDILLDTIISVEFSKLDNMIALDITYTEQGKKYIKIFTLTRKLCRIIPLNTNRIETKPNTNSKTRVIVNLNAIDKFLVLYSKCNKAKCVAWTFITSDGKASNGTNIEATINRINQILNSLRNVIKLSKNFKLSKFSYSVDPDKSIVDFNIEYVPLVSENTDRKHKYRKYKDPYYDFTKKIQYSIQLEQVKGLEKDPDAVTQLAILN